VVGGRFHTGEGGGEETGCHQSSDEDFLPGWAREIPDEDDRHQGEAEIHTYHEPYIPSVNLMKLMEGKVELTSYNPGIDLDWFQWPVAGDFHTRPVCLYGSYAAEDDDVVTDEDENLNDDDGI
jgi:hypothetical protein